MVGENPRAARFFHSLKTNGGSQPQRGPASGVGPSRYTVDGPAKAIYDAQFRLMDDRRWSETTFGNTESMQIWVDQVTHRHWDFYAGPPMQVRIVEHGDRKFSYGPGRIYIPRGLKAAWRALHLIHELAHCYGDRYGHDLTFVRTMCSLMDGIYGQHTGDLFRQHLTTEGVQI